MPEGHEDVGGEPGLVSDPGAKALNGRRQAMRTAKFLYDTI
jgi:hypothetical protein